MRRLEKFRPFKYRTKGAQRGKVTVTEVSTDESIAHAFKVVTSKRTFSIVADNDAERDAWVDAIRAACAES